MELPKNKKLTKVVHIYENGDEYYIEGKDVEKYKENMQTAGTMSYVHRVRFNPLDWKKK